MDRRQRKTREAIFNAFTGLLAKKDFAAITVGEIIEKADVGRATFYAHFETKDYLLKELNEELFCHVFDSMMDSAVNHRHIFDCKESDSLFLHLLYHIYRNDNHILDLFSSVNNELFLRYFKNCMINLLSARKDVTEKSKPKNVPSDFWINHIASAFIECIRWWTDGNAHLAPSEVSDYFLVSVNLKEDFDEKNVDCC
ncbi:MAG: TetR/AcrR family transcriptional regulator [Clostridia bacterium]|nr:TetR/AcrR family transcriptional regulator [Clostridia bacterium]